MTFLVLLSGIYSFFPVWEGRNLSGSIDCSLNFVESEGVIWR